MESSAEGREDCTGGSLEFDGTGWVEVFYTSPLDLQDTSYTIEAWVRASDLPNGKHATLLSKRSADTEGYFLSLAGISHGDLIPGTPVYQINDEQVVNDELGVEPDTWTHVAVSFHRQLNRLGMFIDGVRVHDATSPASLSANGSRLYVGKDVNGSDDRYWFTGFMDEVRVSTNARYMDDFTPQQRFETDENTLLLWHFDEGAGGVAQDEMGSHHGGLQTDTGSTPQWSDITICD